uniref:Transcription factor CBF/NF-Y/archaeal histone domain-containing protein n=1 Tax=Kalanchoe fedtschenkoi TaxID=63787 RepID=A0A7N0UF23_KALFE
MEENQDRLLPIANVGRIMRRVLPQNAKISKAAKERMQEYATEFISFVTSEASDKCRKDNRKTINGDDICRALNHLGFDNLGESTTRYLNKFREFEREKLLSQLHREEATTLGASCSYPPKSRDHCKDLADEEARDSRESKGDQPQYLGLHLQQRSENFTVALGFIN